MAYDGDKLKTAPTTWADFWDTKKIPGKRAMRKGARYNLEFALMADGVKPADVYKVLATKDGADRAFKKLTELKPSIQWWEAGAQPPQFLVAGDVVMATLPSDHLDRRHLRPRLLDHHEGNAQQGRGAEVHRLREHAGRASRVCEEHRLRPDQHACACQARCEDAGQLADRAGEREGRAAVQSQVLGRPRRRAREALRFVGCAVDVADREPAIAGSSGCPIDR
jgi:hypothetical protein